MIARPPTGHILLRERRRGPVFYLHYRLPSGRQVQKLLGNAWAGAGSAPEGYYTERMAAEALAMVLEKAWRTVTNERQDMDLGESLDDTCAIVALTERLLAVDLDVEWSADQDELEDRLWAALGIASEDPNALTENALYEKWGNVAQAMFEAGWLDTATICQNEALEPREVEG